MHLLLLKKRYQYIYQIYQPLFFGQVTFHMRVVSVPEMTQEEFVSRSIKSEFYFFRYLSFEFAFTWIVKHLKMLFRKSFFPFQQLLIGNFILYMYFRLNTDKRLLVEGNQETRRRIKMGLPVKLGLPFEFSIFFIVVLVKKWRMIDIISV